jgi:stress response protein SCP2
MSSPLVIKRHEKTGKYPRLGYGVSWAPHSDTATPAEVASIHRQIELMQEPPGLLGRVAYRMVPALQAKLAKDAEKFIDLEAVVLLVSNRQIKGHVDGINCYGLDGAILHSSDDSTGYSGGLDEYVTIDLQTLPADIDALALVVDSHNGHALGRVAGAACELFFSEENKLISRHDLDASDTPHTSHLFALVRRRGDDFVVEVINQAFYCKGFDDVETVLRKHTW